MLAGKPQINTILLKALISVCFIAAFASCTIVKNQQPGKPYVYKTNINLIGNFSNDEKKELQARLKEQLDDSVRVRKVDKLLWSVLKKPPVYDSSSADQSLIFMKALLKSLGYFNDSMYHEHKIDTVNKDEYRTTIDFYVRPGKVFRLDTIVYNIGHAELQHLTDSTIKEAYINKGDPFAKNMISAEIDRLTELYRNSGYLRFNRDELIGVWDTLNIELLRPTLDPFEQLEILQKLREKKENPTVRLEIRLRNPDSTRFLKYYVGNVTVYPDYILDTLDLERKVSVVEDITVIQHRNKFKPKIFPSNIYLPRGSVYQQRRYLRTINRFTSLGTWELVGIDQIPRRNQDTVDFVIKLTPAKKYSFNTNIEGSVNQSAVSGNLFGIGLNVGLQNRNFAKAANITNTNARYGVELGNTGGDNFIQTRQLSLTHNIYVPRFIPFPKLIPERIKDNFRTILTSSIASTERRLYYDLLTANIAFGHEYQRRNLLVTTKLLNIEFSDLNKTKKLDTLIEINPSLKTIFTDGLIVSFIGNVTLTGGRRNALNVFRANFEGAPLFAGWIRNDFLDSQLYRFIKIDAEFARLIRYRKAAVALRIFGGIGIADPFNTTRNPNKVDNLPFFKQYFSGGPNSMRAWAIRRLGPGSVVKNFTETPDRYGDIQLEANVEFRFAIGRPFGIALNGALFTDAGNIWFLKQAAGRPDEEVFKFSRLGTDIAIGTGAGLRVDFNFLILRFDYAYKVKDPTPSPENAALKNKWFGYHIFAGDQFQLGINYPFIW